MSKSVVLDFLEDCSSKPDLLSRLNDRNLSELLFHAKALGFGFSAEDLTAVAGMMEWHIITEIQKEELNAYSSLWPRMWGKPRLQYVIDELFLKLKKEEWAAML